MYSRYAHPLPYCRYISLRLNAVSEFWNNHPASDKCVPKVATIDLSYAMAGVNAAADWSLGVLPLFIVWDLQMTTKTKILVSAILAFAAIGSTATLVRMKYIHSLIEGEDFLCTFICTPLWRSNEADHLVQMLEQTSLFGVQSSLELVSRHCL
jgi:hypothetical protein